MANSTSAPGRRPAFDSRSQIGALAIIEKALPVLPPSVTPPGMRPYATRFGKLLQKVAW